ncbi:MAG: hypothetical protein ABJA98_17750 [Acidobacteriota bacterium]
MKPTGFQPVSVEITTELAETTEQTRASDFSVIPVTSRLTLKTDCQMRTLDRLTPTV